MLHSKEMGDKLKTMHDLQGIEELHINEGCVIEIEAGIANFKNLAAVSD